MCDNRRAWGARFAALLVAVGVAVGMPALAQDGWFGWGAAADLEIKAEPLLDGWVRSGELAAVRVQILNKGGATEALVELETYDVQGGSRRFRRKVELAEAAKKDVVLYYRPGVSQTDQKVAVVAGRAVFEAEFKLKYVAEPDVLIGVIGDDPVGINGITDAWPGRVPGTRVRDYGSDPRAVRVGLIPVSGLPDKAFGYDSVDWLVWPQADPSALPPEELEALRDWVADGGHLAITVSDNWRQVQGSPLAELLPVELVGVQDASLDRLMVAVGGAPSGDQPTPVATAKPGDQAEVLSWLDDGRPAWVAGTWGLGTTHVLLANPGIAPLRGGTLSRDRLWRRLLWLPEPGGAFVGLPASLMEPMHLNNLSNFSVMSPERTYEGDRASRWVQDVREQLASIPGVAPLPMGWLIAFSTLYLLVIGPVDYVVLRMLGRQPWTWVTFPAYIVVFSAVALVGTALVKGNQAVVTRLEVVDVLGNSGVWRGHSYLGVFSTAKTDVSLRSGFGDGVVGPLGDGGYARSVVEETAARPGKLTWRADTYTLGYAESQWLEARPGRMVVTELPLGGLRLRNELGIDLREVSVHRGTDLYRIGDLAAGAEASVSDTDVAYAPSLEEVFWDRPAETDAAFQQRRMFDVPERSRGYIDPAGGTTVVMGLTDPVETLEIEGLNPTWRESTLIRVILFDAERGPPPTPSPPPEAPVYDTGGTP